MCCKNYPIVTGKTTVQSLLKKFQLFKLSTLLKRDFNTGVFLWILRNFYEQIFQKNICEQLLLKVVFMWKKEIIISFISKFKQSERKTSVSFKSCFPLAEVINNFLVSWNYGLKNFICSSKESIISQGSLPPKFFNDESSRKKN